MFVHELIEKIFLKNEICFFADSVFEFLWRFTGVFHQQNIILISEQGSKFSHSQIRSSLKFCHHTQRLLLAH